jgi:hypothetical protein
MKSDSKTIIKSDSKLAERIWPLTQYENVRQFELRFEHEFFSQNINARFVRREPFLDVMCRGQTIEQAIKAAITCIGKAEKIEAMHGHQIMPPALNEGTGTRATEVYFGQEVRFLREEHGSVITSIFIKDENGFHVVDEPFDLPAHWIFVKDWDDGSKLYAWEPAADPTDPSTDSRLLCSLCGHTGQAFVKDGKVIKIASRLMI